MTNNASKTEFFILLYDRICSWIVFIVSVILFLAAVFQSNYATGYLLGALFLIAGLLAFIASILLENRARRS